MSIQSACIQHELTWFVCNNFLHCYYTYMYLQELVQGYTVGKFWFFSYAYALNFINHCFGSLFWLLGVPIGSLFHKKLGPYFKAWGSLLVLVTVRMNWMWRPKMKQFSASWILLFSPTPDCHSPMHDGLSSVDVGQRKVYSTLFGQARQGLRYLHMVPPNPSPLAMQGCHWEFNQIRNLFSIKLKE